MNNAALADGVYPSRIDAWLVAVLVGAVLLCGVPVWLHWHQPGAAAWAVAIAVLTLGVIVAVTVPCRYTLTADDLLIRCGLIRQRIPLRTISRVEPSSSIVSAPALSLRRLKVSYGRRAQYISPRDRAGFIAELTRRAPHVVA